MNVKSVYSFIMLICSLLILSGCSDNSEETSAKTIAILAQSDFVPDRTAIAERSQVGLPDVLADRIIEHLTVSKRFIPVDRKALRRTVLEQRFGKNLSNSYLDQTLDKAIDSMKKIDGGGIKGVDGKEVSPTPVGNGISEGSGTVGTTGTLANYNDILKDFQDLGTTVGADYLVLGNLEKLSHQLQTTAVPYSQQDRVQVKHSIDARLNLRIIDSKKGTVIGATSLRTRIAETVFTGKRSDSDEFTFYDHLGRLAAVKVLDVIYPARIVSADPLVISRGSNDGALVGDIYQIEREGQSITDDSGQTIARLKDKVGRAQVVSVQETVAVVKPLDSSQFHKGDLAVLDTEASASTSPATAQVAIPLKGSAVISQQRPRIAVTLIKSGSTETPADKSAEQQIPLFTDTLVSRLTQTKRFAVLDRQEVNQLLTEQTLMALREGRDLASAVGSLKAADYLVYGNLANFSIEEKQTRLPGSSRIFKNKTGYLQGNMRLVDARSGQVMESRKISVQQNVDVQADESRLVSELADDYAEQVVLMLMNKLYPIRIAAIGEEGTAYINRGDDGGLYRGEILDAYRLGKAVIDPETGVQLGQEELALGQVRVDEVEDARSKGSALKGIKIAKGDLLKRTLQNRGKQGKALRPEQSQPARTGAFITDHGNPNQNITPSGDGITLVVGQLKVNPGARSSALLKAERIRKMTNDLIFKLAHSNRFSVLERQEIDQILDEKSFDAIVSGGNIDSRLRELTGADYLIQGDIDSFYIDTRTHDVPYLDEKETTATAIAQGVFRIVDVHSGEVKAGDRLRVKINVDNVKDMDEVEYQLQDAFSTKAVAQILIRLFPIKILGIAGDGTVFVNRGMDAGLKTGELFDVMRPGQALIDPDTGRSFGSAETKIATVQLIAVEDARSRALIKAGENVLAGDILRKSQSLPKAPETQAFTPNW